MIWHKVKGMLAEVKKKTPKLLLIHFSKNTVRYLSLISELHVCEVLFSLEEMIEKKACQFHASRPSNFQL